MTFLLDSTHYNKHLHQLILIVDQLTLVREGRRRRAKAQ
jgi:hypothetical protein